MLPPWAVEKQPRRHPRRLYVRTVAMPEVSETDFAIVVFREDDARTRKNYGPQNLAVIRRIAIDILLLLCHKFPRCERAGIAL